MELPIELSKEFAALILGASKIKPKETVAYGTVVKNGEGIFVQLDGSDMPTPVSKAMDAEDGDRVMVTIQNHKATIVGNITSPASARTATNYMKLTEDGLVIGNIGTNGEPSGTYSLIAPGEYKIMSELKAELASFSSDVISLLKGRAKFGTDAISLADGDATFSSDEITIGKGDNKAVFKKNAILLSDGEASFSASGVTLGKDSYKTTFDSSGITLANGDAVFTKDKVEIGKGGNKSKFTPSGLSLSNEAVVIDESGINIRNGAALFNKSGVSFTGGNSITANEVTLNNGMAYFSKSLLKLGNTKESVIELCDGNGKIKMDDSALCILTYSVPVGIRSTFGTAKSEVVAKADQNVTQAALQVFSGADLQSSVIADREGVRFSTPSGKPLYNNGQEVIQSNRFLAKGRITINGNLKAGSFKTFSDTVSLPAGYFLGGIRDIQTNHHNACKITQFITDPSTKKIGVTLANTGSRDFKWKKKKDSNGNDTNEWETEGLTVSIEWFAFRCDAEIDNGVKHVDWTALD